MIQEIVLGLISLGLMSSVSIWLACISNQQQEARQIQKRQIVRKTMHAESEVFRLTSQALDEMGDLATKDRAS